jgi:hypothetical protein
MSVSTINLKILCDPSSLPKVLVIKRMVLPQSKVLIKNSLLLLTKVLMKLLIKYPLLLLTKVLMPELLIKYPLHLLTKVLTEHLMRKTRTRKNL